MEPFITKAVKEFMECDTCRAKPGSPYLCKGCLHNRDVIFELSQAYILGKEEGREETGNIYHKLGKRDAVAEILMMARDTNPNEVLREMARQLLEVDKEHPHAKWVLANILTNPKTGE